MLRQEDEKHPAIARNAPQDDFPGAIEISVGTVVIQSQYVPRENTGNGFECKYYTSANLPVSSEGLIEIGCGSFFVTNLPISRKSQIDDAISIVMSGEYPITIVADGAFGKCNPEDIQKVCNDPVILDLAKELRMEVKKIFSDYDSNDVLKKSEGINKLIEMQVIRILHETETRIKKITRDSHMSLSFAIPLLAILSDGMEIRKIIAFGIGNDVIYKLSPESKEAEPLKERQQFIAEKTKGKFSNIELISFASDAEEVKSDNSYTIDKAFIPGLDKTDSLTMNLIPVSVADFKEGDKLIVSTDGVSRIVDHYNQTINIINDIHRSIKADDFTYYPIINNMPPLDQQNIIKKFLEETNNLVKVAIPISAAKILAMDDPIAELTSYFDALKELNKSLLSIIPTFIIGDDIAFSKITLDSKKINDYCWQLIAEHQDLLIKIISDNDYWKTKKHGLWGIPKGVGKLQAEIKKDNTHLMSRDISSILTEIYEARNKQSVPGMDDEVKKRDPMTNNLYNLGKINPEDWYKAPEFRALYTDWYTWNLNKNRNDNIRVLYVNPRLEIKEREQLTSGIKNLSQF